MKRIPNYWLTFDDSHHFAIFLINSLLALLKFIFFASTVKSQGRGRTRSVLESMRTIVIIFFNFHCSLFNLYCSEIFQKIFKNYSGVLQNFFKILQNFNICFLHSSFFKSDYFSKNRYSALRMYKKPVQRVLWQIWTTRNVRVCSAL